MARPVFWVVEGAIQQGAPDALRALIDEMVTSTKADEPGTMAYEWFVDSGGKKCHIFERYRDSAAAMIHLRTFDQKYAQRLGRLVRIERVTLFGNASEEVMRALGEEGTVFLLPLTGFTR
jgi:quinol monooxygenase YgiN